FGDTWKVISMPSKNILSNVDEFYKREGEVGYSTNGYLVLDYLIQNKYIADKVMMFTDVQLWDSVSMNSLIGNTISAKWKLYKKIAPNSKLYLFDLAGYGQMPLETKENDVYLIAGWSDKIFDVLQALEEGGSAMTEIEKVVI
ncbi:MAG: TROVE domain-containing protein, partial [Cytophagales bacterium]|nr:TROVE domain-containing protein [Cytophagales bacterium]